MRSRDWAVDVGGTGPGDEPHVVDDGVVEGFGRRDAVRGQLEPEERAVDPVGAVLDQAADLLPTDLPKVNLGTSLASFIAMHFNCL